MRPPWARRTRGRCGLEGVRADVAFLGANAISSEHGLATPDEIEAELKAALIRSRACRVLLADHSRSSAAGPSTGMPCSPTSMCSSPTRGSQADADAITRDHGVEVIRA